MKLLKLKINLPIYNFVRENEFPTKHNTALKSQFGIAPDEKVLIHVSNFRQVKRIDTIIEKLQKYVKIT